jgi:hypothetical protein
MPIPKHLNPLTPQDLEELAQIEREANDTRVVLEHCQACGLPVEEALTRTQEQINVASGMRKEFAHRRGR